MRGATASDDSGGVVQLANRGPPRRLTLSAPPYRPDMDRRRFLLTLLAGALAAPPTAGAQETKVYRLGGLFQGSPPPLAGVRLPPWCRWSNSC
jgi:hypothetical protein